MVARAVTAAEAAAVQAEYARTEGGAPRFQIRAMDTANKDAGLYLATKSNQYGLFQSYAGGVNREFKASVGGDNYFFLADDERQAPGKFGTGGTGVQTLDAATWGAGTDVKFGAVKGKLFHDDPVTVGGTWRSDANSSFLQDVLVAFSGPIIAVAGIALAPAAAAGGGGAASGGAATGAGAGGVSGGGVAAGGSGFTLSGSIPAYTAAQNAVGAELALAGTSGTGFAATTAGASIVGGAGTSLASGSVTTTTWGELATKAGGYLSTATKVASAATATKAAFGSSSSNNGAIGSSGNTIQTSAANPLGLSQSALTSGNPLLRYADSDSAAGLGEQRATQLTPLATIGGFPIWMLATLAGVAIFLARS